MLLTQDMTIVDLVSRFPFLIDELADHNTTFVKLRNPVLRQTLGRMATVKRAAVMGKEKTLELMLFIAGRIMAKTGATVEIEPPPVAGNGEQGESMSDTKRQENLKEIIHQLHHGADMAGLQEKFAQTIGDISAEEIAKLEQSLVRDGLAESEIKRLCNLHVQLFQGGLARQEKPRMAAGHPVHTYMEENRRAEALIEDIRVELERLGENPGNTLWAFVVNPLRRMVNDLCALHIHYLRKENQLFPLLEEHGLEAQAKVMWEIHDDIRRKGKEAAGLLQGDDRPAACAAVREFIQAAGDMIGKEEQILLPMALQILPEEAWSRVRRGEDEIGYAFEVAPGGDWLPAVAVTSDQGGTPGLIDLATGRLSPEVLSGILCNLPVDISFVDANDQVAYYSDSVHRIFPRSAAIIGRNVKNCHPPKSIGMVTGILEKFKSGAEDKAEFWLEMNGRFIHIQYLALRGGDGAYFGCLEVGQDATYLRSLTGQRRLLEWK